MCRFQLKLFYTLQCGFYIYSVAALLYWETRRKDFNVMMTHHIVTIGLISYSYIGGYVSSRVPTLMILVCSMYYSFSLAIRALYGTGLHVNASRLLLYPERNN